MLLNTTLAQTRRDTIGFEQTNNAFYQVLRLFRTVYYLREATVSDGGDSVGRWR